VVSLRVIIDAANVAHYKKGQNGKARLSNIIAAIKALEKGNHEFLIIADASLRHSIDQKEQYEKLVEDGIIDEVPVGQIADHFILETAEQEKAKILSNDKYRDFADEFQDIKNMRMPFTIKGDKLTFGKPKKPKKVKNLLQNVSDEILNEIERKRWEVYTEKTTQPFSPLNVAKAAILQLDQSNQKTMGTRIENAFHKVPMFKNVMAMVDDVETAAPYVIFVLVHPKDYKAAVHDAGNISVTVADRLHLINRPLIAVRNDLFVKPGEFALNIIVSDEVEDICPFNVEIRINSFDEMFVKNNSRNIASTIAARLGSWKFPYVSVKSDMLMEKPGDFDIYLEKGGKPDG